MPRVRLFVYGSLKRGARHHDELRGARFLGEAQTLPGHALVELGGYLALVEDPAGGVVRGELFEVSESLLPALDRFEGDAYVRRQTAVRASGLAETGMALAYFRKAR